MAEKNSSKKLKFFGNTLGTSGKRERGGGDDKKELKLTLFGQLSLKRSPPASALFQLLLTTLIHF